MNNNEEISRSVKKSKGKGLNRSTAVLDNSYTNFDDNNLNLSAIEGDKDIFIPSGKIYLLIIKETLIYQVQTCL